jgi:hypothetical protein
VIRKSKENNELISEAIEKNNTYIGRNFFINTYTMDRIWLHNAFGVMASVLYRNIRDEHSSI